MNLENFSLRSVPSAQLAKMETSALLSLSRLEARDSLIAFTEQTHPRYVTGKFHKRVAEQLERVERGEIDRLMILAPPRHGKSELTSRRLPAWFMGRNPHKHIISASAAEPLATDFGRDVRDIVRSLEFRDIFDDVSLSEDSQAAGRWNTNKGGGYFAVGVGTQIMGRGGHLNLIDDPFATWEDAQSELKQQRVWDWYQGSLYNRQEPGAAFILINHRMHEGDLSGRLIEKMKQGGDKWYVLDCKAIGDDGEPLSPERYDLAALERIKANTDRRIWSALYQQNPQPEDGTFFMRAWFDRYDEAPAELTVFGASDYAVTEGDGDYTEHGVVGIAPDSRLYLLDWWRGQTTSDKWIESKLDLVAKHEPIAWFGEGGVIQKAIEPALKKRMRMRNDFVRLEWLPSVKDKPTRARSFQALAANKQVLLPNTQWADDLIDQMVRFPGGKFDDGVDVCSLMGRAIADMHPAIASALPKKGRPDDLWEDEDEDEDGWKTR